MNKLIKLHQIFELPIGTHGSGLSMTEMMLDEEDSELDEVDYFLKKSASAGISSEKTKKGILITDQRNNKVLFYLEPVGAADTFELIIIDKGSHL